ncbi:dorsal-ventral patterning protein Sog [Diabrotica virgifera virgifera]|uniref:Dorsal-ventral patterning protein Sog n=1 Tax=Diabrotica virgifera virgifera TaxID=50390 RepID=A0ABM5IB58_DIAVI|nr:dorsal-ventral patterning protein Sog [Diabrotica virgifera virgifera]
MQVSRLLVFVTAFLAVLGLVQARMKSPLIDEDLPRSRNKAAECVFGKQIRELGSQWIPDLGVPIGVLYCMKCECVPFQRKRRIVARVQCRNIKNECPEPTCEDPVLLPERCCKICPGDNKNEPDVIQDIVPQNVIEEEERRINHFAALLTGRSSLDLRNDTMPKDLNKNNVVATGRFTFHRRNLHYSFYISEKAARPKFLHILDNQGNILEDFTLSHAGGLVNSPYQNATRKICGIWRRLPRDYRRLLKQEKLYVQLIWGTKDSEFTLSGKLTKYVALASELFSSLLEPAPGTDSAKMAGSGGTALVSTSSTPSPSVHVAVIFNGLFTSEESTGVPINVMLALDEKKQIIIEGNIKVNKPAPDLNLIELSSPVTLADLRSLSRGRVLLTVSSVSEPSALRLSGSIITKVTCEIFQALLVGDRDLASTSNGLAWMYLNNQGALIYTIQIDNRNTDQLHNVTLTDASGKRKAEVLTPYFHTGVAHGAEDRMVHKILEPLYNSRLDMRISVGNSSLHGHLNSKLVADARDGPAPILLKRENYSLPSTVGGIVWISVDSECHIHYDLSISGLGHERKLELYLEMYPIIAPGAPVLIKTLEEFEGNQVEGSPIEYLTKEELDMLDGGVTFVKLKDSLHKVVLLSATLTKIKLPISCRPPRDNNIIPVISGTYGNSRDQPGVGHPTESCFFEGKFYKKDSTWVSKNPCQMCFCQDGQPTCDVMNCPDIKCPHKNFTTPGECCSICGEPAILMSTKKCIFNGRTYSPGSKFHPFLIPIGFDDCTVCTCDPIDLEIKCKRIDSNTDKCGKGAATTPDTISDDNIGNWPIQRKEEVSNSELILKEGGCRNRMNPERPYRNQSTYHPYISSLGEYKCVTCKCQNGQSNCARERCEWKNCKMMFELRKSKSRNNKKSFPEEYCCTIKECRRIRHRKKLEERASHKQ